MRLSSALVERALRQFEGQVIPEDHPAVPQLTELFGDHTFFIDGRGLNIVEPAGPTEAGVEAGKVVELARWTDANPPSLVPHPPEPTETVIMLGAAH